MKVSRSWSNSRSTNEEDGPPKKKKKKNTEVVVRQKNPVMALNEMKPNVVYDITGSGPPHARIYSASVTINGKTYSAEDTTKKKAKARVAQMILQCSVQLKDPSIKAPLDTVGKVEDFSQDLSEVVCGSEDFYSFESAIVEQVKAVPISVTNPDSAKTNPVFCLNRLRPGIKIEIVKEEGSPHSRTYTARGKSSSNKCIFVRFNLYKLFVSFLLVVVDDKTYEGVGSNKKQAKNEAAYLALRNAFDFEVADGPQPDKPLDTDFGDFIAR